MRTYGDARGSFAETYQRWGFEAGGISCEFVQDNQSSSVCGVLRGLHYQVERPLAKLVRVVCGNMHDVCVGLYPDSPTFGGWEGTFLSSDNRLRFFIPRGFAYGIMVLSDTVEFC